MRFSLTRTVLAAGLIAAGCAASPKTRSTPTSEATRSPATATLHGRVVAQRPNALLPGGEQVGPVPGARVMLYHPSFSQPISPGTYSCEFERFVEGERISTYLLHSGWIAVRRGGQPYQGRLEAIAPLPSLTDATGRFVVSGLSPGRYVAEIAAEDHLHRFVEFTLPDSAYSRTFTTEETILDLVPEYVVEP